MAKESSIFSPDPRLAPSVQGVVCVGGELSLHTLKEAYSMGIFPWPIENYPLLWHFPEKRGVLFFSELHVPRSLARLEKKDCYHFTFNQCFTKVMQHCAKQKRSQQEGSWILPELVKAYTRFHKAGYAHSIECWNEKKELVGGLYGVYIQGVFSGESMFHTENNTSKLCLLKIIEKLQEEGHTWIDTQMVTPVLKTLGARSISKKKFLRLLKEAQGRSSSEKLFLK